MIPNDIFFPEQIPITYRFWQISSSATPYTMDVRTYNNTIPVPAGKTLQTAGSPRELSRAWADSLLGCVRHHPLHLSNSSGLHSGWLSVYLSGYLHRDICLGNILMDPWSSKQGLRGKVSRFRRSSWMIYPRGMTWVQRWRSGSCVGKFKRS